MADAETAEDPVYVSDALRGGLPETILLGPKGGCGGRLRYIEGYILFRVKVEGFLFGASFLRGFLAVVRNNVAVQLPVGTDEFDFQFEWFPTSLRLFICDDNGERRSAFETTEPTMPTAELMQRARFRGVTAPARPYRDAHDVINELTIQLLSLRRNLQSGGWMAFWEGDKPRREPQITSQIHGLIVDQLEGIKRIQVQHEPTSGPGRIDFLFRTKLATGEDVKVCCEFKMGHSERLIHGIEQLLEYMATECTSHGIFVVLDFGLPAKDSIPIEGRPWPNDHPDFIRFHVPAYAISRGVRPVVLRVSKPDQPSVPKTKRKKKTPP